MTIDPAQDVFAGLGGREGIVTPISRKLTCKVGVIRMGYQPPAAVCL
jgi:hypothetical protein